MLPFEMSQTIAESFVIIGIIATAIILFLLGAYILDFLCQLINLYLKSETILKILDEYEKKEKISPIPIILISIALLLLTFAGGLMAGYNFFMQEKVKQEVHAWCSDTNNTSTCCMTCDQINKAKCYNQITNEWTCTPNTLCPNCLDTTIPDNLEYTTTTWETPTQKSFTNTQDKNTPNALYGTN